MFKLEYAQMLYLEEYRVVSIDDVDPALDRYMPIYVMVCIGFRKTSENSQKYNKN